MLLSDSVITIAKFVKDLEILVDCDLKSMKHIDSTVIP